MQDKSAVQPSEGKRAKARVALITGAGQGIGRAFAHAFAASGTAVAVVDINRDKADAVVEEIRSLGGSAVAETVDVSNAASVDNMAAVIADNFGSIDILINNAAIFSTLKMRPFYEIPLEEWQRVMEVNISGVFLCARAVLPYMRREGWGRIINISSGAVTLGRPNYTHYTTSKAAVIGMTRSMARELGPFGITVNSILPGATFTEIPRETITPEWREKIISQQCIHRPQTPDDLVGAALFLSSDQAEFITGQSLTVDGGATHL